MDCATMEKLSDMQNTLTLSKPFNTACPTVFGSPCSKRCIQRYQVQLVALCLWYSSGVTLTLCMPSPCCQHQGSFLSPFLHSIWWLLELIPLSAFPVMLSYWLNGECELVWTDSWTTESLAEVSGLRLITWILDCMEWVNDCPED